MKMTTVNFSFNIKGIDDKDLIENGRPVHAGNLIAGLLAGQVKGDAYKLMEWAREAYNHREIKLNPDERETMIKIIKETETMTVLAKAQLLSVFA